MSVWLAVQAVYALVAWVSAARPVVRLHRALGALDAGLAATVAELRRARRGAEITTLPARLGVPSLDALFEIDPDAVSADQLVAAAADVASDLAPPTRVLRTLATIGTTLGLLAAIATLARSAGETNGVALQAAASRAFDSAVAGFVTAIPCWTAIALGRNALARTRAGLDRVLLAMRAEPPADDAGLDVSPAGR